MNDHVHVIIRPAENHRLQDILYSWKSFTAHTFRKQFGRTGSVWQDESFDRIIRDDQECFEKMLYILNNARKRWPELESYPWVWCRGMDTNTEVHCSV